MGDAVNEFGVHNFYANRLISIVHQKFAKARDKNAKDGCYHTLKILHQHLGDNWKEVLAAPMSKSTKKTMMKKFDKNKNAGTYTQLRCIKKEDAPKPEGGEMEEYEEEVEEWVEIVPDPPAGQPAAAVQPAAAAEPKAAEPVAAAPAEPEPEEPKEPTPEPEPEPTPPPPAGPLQSDKKGVKYRLGKCKKMVKLFEQSKPLDKGYVDVCCCS